MIIKQKLVKKGRKKCQLQFYDALVFWVFHLCVCEREEGKVVLTCYQNTFHVTKCTPCHPNVIAHDRGADRTCEEIEIIYEELLHISALSHLSCMVKRELASVIVFESHPKAGTVRECNMCVCHHVWLSPTSFMSALAHRKRQIIKA